MTYRYNKRYSRRYNAVMGTIDAIVTWGFLVVLPFGMGVRGLIVGDRSAVLLGFGFSLPWLVLWAWLSWRDRRER